MDVLLLRNVKAGDIKVRDAKGLCRCIVFALLAKKRVHDLNFHHRLTNSTIAHTSHSRVFSHKTGEHYVVCDVRYVHIDKVYSVFCFKRSRVAK